MNDELENRIKELEIELSSLKSDLIAGKQSELALKESNDKFLSLSDNIIGYLAFVNINTLKYEFVNNLYEKSTGIPKDKIIGSHLKDIIGQTNYQSALNYIDEIKSGNPVSFENTFENITGKRWMQANYIPLADSNGHIISFAILSFDITERKKNEEKLLFIIKAVESASDAIGISDAQGHHFYQNKALTDLFEYSTAEEMEAAGGGAIVISDPQVAKEMYGNIMSGKSWSGELEMKTKSGRVFPAFERADAIKDSGGNVIGLIGVVTDITDRRQAELALKENEEKLKNALLDANRFSEIIDKLPSYVYMKNRKHQYLYANQQTLGFIKRSKETLPGCDDTEFFPRATVEELWEIDNQVFENGMIARKEIEVYNDDNKRIVCWEIKYPLYNELGEIYGLCGIDTDISDRKLAEEMLRKSEQKISEALQFNRKILDTSSIGILTYRKSGQCTFANSAACKVGGAAEKQLLTQNFHEIPSWKNSGIYEVAIKALDTGIEQVTEVHFVTLFSKDVWLNLNFSSFLFEGEQHLLVFVSDITDNKRAEKTLIASETKLLQLNTDKDLFISILSHDLKSPFNALLGLSELLVENIRQYDINEFERIAKDINTSARNSFNLLEDILMWARTQSGKIPFKLQNLCFADICKDILKNLKPNSDAKNITINYFPQNPLNILADINMLKTVLRNLVTNAIKFTNNDGTISISAEQTGSNIIISVSDNGIGIEPDELTKLFDISQIISTRGTAEETGTGLGLLLCKEFVEKHGGKIWVVSEAGKGSVFKFTLPQFLNIPMQ